MNNPESKEWGPFQAELEIYLLLLLLCLASVIVLLAGLSILRSPLHWTNWGKLSAFVNLDYHVATELA